MDRIRILSLGLISSPMGAMIVLIGNSKGLRIPKAVLQQCHFTKEVNLEVRSEIVVLKSVYKEAARRVE